MVIKKNIIWLVLLLINLGLFIAMQCWSYGLLDYRYLVFNNLIAFLLIWLYFDLFSLFLFLLFKCRRLHLLKFTILIGISVLLLFNVMCPIHVAFASYTTDLHNYMKLDRQMYINKKRFNCINEEGITFFPKEVSNQNIEYEYYYRYQVLYDDAARIYLTEKYEVSSQFLSQKQFLEETHLVSYTSNSWQIFVIDIAIYPKGLWPAHNLVIALNENRQEIIYIYDDYIDREKVWINNLLDNAILDYSK